MACATINLKPQSTGTSRYHGSTINHRQPKCNKPNGSSFTVIGTDRQTSILDACPTTAFVDPQVPLHQLSPSWIAGSTLHLLCFMFCGSEEGRKRSFSYLVGSKKKKKSFILLLVVLREVGSIWLNCLQLPLPMWWSLIFQEGHNWSKGRIILEDDFKRFFGFKYFWVQIFQHGYGHGAAMSFVHLYDLEDKVHF